jgi:hypothetical protein
MLDKATPAQVFDTLRVAQRADNDLYDDCYLIAHRIGEVVAGREDWRVSLSEDPSGGMCSGGYAYGLAAAGITRRPSDLVSAETCEGLPPSVSAGCLKALGSAYHHATSADVGRAFDACDDLAQGSPNSARVRELCYEGVIHDALMPLHPGVAADPTLHGVTRDSSEGFCHALGDALRVDTCLIGRWALYADDLVDAESIKRFCSHVSNKGQARCFERMYRSIGWRFADEPARVRAACVGFSDAESCLIDAAASVVRERGIVAALALCDDASCGERVSGLAGAFARVGTSARAALCSGVPEAYRTRCLSL